MIQATIIILRVPTISLMIHQIYSKNQCLFLAKKVIEIQNKQFKVLISQVVNKANRTQEEVMRLKMNTDW